MDVNRLALDYSASLPMWVLEELVDEPDAYQTDEQKMALVNRLARRNYREGTGGPFAAIVVDSETGELVSAGVNVVLASGLSAAHAEVVALSLAQAAVGGWDLGADAATPREIIVNWRPCVQCYGAVLWSGVTRLVVAGDGPELEHLTGFDEGPMREDWAEQFETRGIAVTEDVLRDEAIAVFREYGEVAAAGEATVYNARAQGALER
ncbi:nucleoside deaminase [Galbitalea sp. SE-J8]|uniref:nucleoside deaminase n=1 Tax=Galbitalea sp. SE-J8 TaxID=3054952 RepID=UPI00259D00D4|nr:nucleoside deaminase [Galbitalea sp. SE-J8]MDM4764284.1 nucleoside deaminase [Galbitalea sp. SE-J8]